MNKEKLLVSAILFNHNVPKNEAKIIGALIENLEHQCRKQKEVIDKAIEYVNKQIKDDYYCRKSDYLINNLLDILKGVSE